ncbi:MAG: glutathione S-transferase family protein [Arenicellales bacterium]|jgi:glutathione S-transferase|nr:glutathione S-transferase family protein [Arenicellales bacterium]
MSVKQKIKFYAVPVSTYCARVRIILRLKSIDFEELLPPGGNYNTTEYRRLIPAGSVPAIEIGGFRLHDSAAIAEFLDEQYPEPAMWPQNVQKRAVLRSIAHFHDTRLEPALRVLFPMVGQSPESPEKITSAINHIVECLKRLDSLVEPSPYLGGDRLSLADCVYPTTLFMLEDVVNALEKKITLPSKISNWQKALYDNLIVRRVVDDNRDAISAWVQKKLLSI